MQLLHRQYTLFFALLAVFILIPLFPEKILETGSPNDLANHVRHTFEYQQALQEGQLPPLVAPTLNQVRPPLFQFYSGTGYTLPALLNFVTHNPYTALKLSIFLLSFFTSTFLFLILKKIMQNAMAAFVGAITFQLFNFSMIDLYFRGGFIEWESMQLMGLCFASLIHLCNTLTAPSLFLNRLLAIMAVSFFIPLHPAQTLYSGAVIAILSVSYVFTYLDKRLWVNAFLNLSGVFLLSLALTAWFWLPVLQYHSLLKIKNSFLFLNSNITFTTLIWPWFHSNKMIGWAPQIGSGITLSLLFLLTQWKKLNGFVKTTLLLLMVLLGLVLCPQYFHIRLIDTLFSPLQFSYRLLIPAALTAAIVVSFAQKYLYTLLKKQTLVFGITVALIFITFLPFLFLKVFIGRYELSLQEVLSPTYTIPSAVGGYTFIGTDYQKLGWASQDKLNTNTELTLPIDAMSFKTELTFVSPALKKLAFTVNPVSGMAGWMKPLTIHFDFSENPVLLRDLKFLPEGDTEWIRLPSSLTTLQTPSYHQPLLASVEVKHTGLYQLPFCYFPSLSICVNGKYVNTLSHDKYLIVVRLNKGKNNIAVETHPSPVTVKLFWFAGIIILIQGLFYVFL